MTQRFSSRIPKTSKSFVIDDNVLKIIETEATKEGISTNSKINAILGKWAFFYRMTEKEGCGIVASSTLDFVIENIDEKKWIEHYTDVLLNTVPAIMIEGGFRLNLITIVKVLFEKALLYAGAYEGFTYYFDDDHYLNLVFRHRRGLKNSKLLGTAYSALIEQVLKLPNILEVSPSSAIIKILAKNIREIDDLMNSS